MKFFFRAILFCLISIVASGDVSGYAYPVQDPYKATFTGVVLRPRSENALGPVAFKKIDLSAFRPNRNNLRFLEGRGQASAQFLYYSPGAPLAFIISGLGGTDQTTSSLYLADRLNERGYNAVVLPSSISWRSSLVISSTGYPGVPQTDAKDYYELMQFILVHLQSAYSVQPAHVSMMGMSYGAFQALHLAELDRVQKKINFHQVITINLPMDIAYGVQQIDRMADKGNSKSPEQRRFLYGYLMATGLELLRRKDFSPEGVLKIELPFAKEDYEFVIGDFLRRPVQEVAFVSQSFFDQGMWSEVYSERLGQSRQVSISDYMNQILPKYLKSHGQSEFQARQDSSYDVTRRLLIQNSNVYVIHNVDDFISREDHVRSLPQFLGSRAKVYPLGGHGGNIWYPENQDYLFGLLGISPNK